MNGLKTALFLLSFFCLMPFLKVNYVYAEDTSVVWSDSLFSSVEDIDYENNVVLFVGDDCEACDALYLSIQSFELDKYYDIQLVNGHTDEAKEVMLNRLEEKGFSTDPLVIPVLMHEDYVSVGYTSINSYLQALNLLKDDEAWLEKVQGIAEETYSKEKEALESQTFFEVISQLDWWILISVGICIFLVITGIVILVVKRKILGKNGKIFLSIGEILLLGGALFFLVNIANTKRQYIPEESLAGCVENVGCDTYAELVAFRAQSEEATPQEKRKANEVFGENQWQDVSIGNVIGDSKNSESEIIRAGYEAVVSGAEALMMAKGKDPTLVGAVTKCGENRVTEQNENDSLATRNYTECIDKALAISKEDDAKKYIEDYLQASNPAEYIYVQFQNIIPQKVLDDMCVNKGYSGRIDYIDCAAQNSGDIIATVNSKMEGYYKKYKDLNSDLLLAEKLNFSSEYREQLKESIDNLKNEINTYLITTGGDVDGISISDLYTISMDPVTKTIIKNPMNMGTVEDFCEVPQLIGGVSVGAVCSCENDNGGSVSTPVFGDVSCDVICRARNLDCDNCSPSVSTVSEPVVNTPTDTTQPYCGDGIFGNTTGEECEKGDPSGVSCTWSTACNDCKCIDVTEPYCGDGEINNDSEECEVGNPTGYTCEWDNCNHINCKCIEPGCGDGNIDEGEQCEKGDPTGTSCLWNSECNQLECSCIVEESEYCGDGKLEEDEVCEEGDPTGSECDWNECSKYTCTCPEEETTTTTTTTTNTTTTTSGSVPQTSILDNSYLRNLTIGATLLALGFLFQPTVRFVDSFYIVVGDKVLKIGRYVLNKEKRETDKRRKNVEKGFK